MKNIKNIEDNKYNPHENRNDKPRNQYQIEIYMTVDNANKYGYQYNSCKYEIYIYRKNIINLIKIQKYKILSFELQSKGAI